MKTATAPLPPLRSVKVLDQLRERIRYLHYSLRTEQAYVHWVRAFIRFHGVRHPATLGSSEVEAFLSWLANERKVSVSTHRQALAALLFFYGKVLCTDLPWLQEIGRPRPSRRLPVVLTPDEVVRILGFLEGEHRLFAQLLYGTGMRISEGLQLRVKDLDFDHGTIIVREGKGSKDRALMLPESLAPSLREQLSRARAWWLKDQAEGRSGVALPDALERKYPRAGHSWPWFWVFAQHTHSTDPRSGVVRRHHMYDQTFQRAFKRALRMKTPESTFPGGLLNREEISFLLRPADKSGLQTLTRSRNAAGELFAGRLAAACSQRLAPLFFHPLSVAAEIGNFDEESSVGFVFSAGGRKIACRLTKADAALLAALALGNAPAAGRAGFRGISLAITRRLLKTLAETAAETLAENDEPKGKNAAFVPLPLCLQLDIRGRKTKIFLSFGCKETPPENNRRMDGAERLRQPLAVRRLNDGTVVLTARMPPFSLPAKEIIQWKKGGWIPLPFMPADPVLLSAEGMPALKAVVGRKGSRIAVKLINKVK